MKPTSLLIVDDHQIIINGIRTMLQSEQGLQIMNDVHNGNEAIEAYERLRPDVVLMDIKMPEKNGIEATREIVSKHPDAKIIGLTMFDDDEYIASMLKAGAKGYLLKNTSRTEIIAAIEKVTAGELYFSSEVTQAVMRRMMGEGSANSSNPVATSGSEKSPEPRSVPLTRREIEILVLIAGEMTNQEIADKLFISQRTVHSHRRNLMQKIGVKNTAGLVRYAMENKLLVQE